MARNTPVLPQLDHSLELSGQELEGLLTVVLSHLTPFLDSLPDQPASNLSESSCVAKPVVPPMPTAGQPVEEVLAELFEQSVPPGLNAAGPGYLCYVPGGGLPHAAVADLISGIVNRYIGVGYAAPALAQLEATVIRWFCRLAGYSDESGGFLTSGGSLANWSAIVLARHVVLGDDFQRGLLYTSDQAHHCVARAAVLAGFPRSNVREIESDERFCIRVDRLEEQIEQDRRAGWRPLAIIANAGTTNTGAIDDLNALADTATRHEMWLHVDAAYGGFFLLTQRGRKRMRGMERADSVVLDPHKSLFLPFGTGCLLARDRAHLRSLHSMRGDYLRETPEVPDSVNFCDISPELTRPFRGLRIWLPLKMHGIEPFQKYLDEKLDLTHWITDRLHAVRTELGDRLEVISEPQLTVVTFRLRRPDLDDAQLDRLNRSLLQRINAGQRVVLSPTMLHGRFVIRICILALRTHSDRVQECLAEITRAVDELQMR